MCIPNISKDSFPYPELIKGFLYLSRAYQEEGREGFQRATAKPFGRARRRETSPFGKAIVFMREQYEVTP